MNPEPRPDPPQDAAALLPLDLAAMFERAAAAPPGAGIDPLAELLAAQALARAGPEGAAALLARLLAQLLGQDGDRRRAAAARQQAQRVEAVGTLAGGIAHDFNNILGAILGFGESALRHTRAGSRLRRDVECIVIAGERGRALVERILEFSRSGVSERLPVHVEAQVREALALLAGSLPPLVRVETALHAGHAALLGDPTQVHQVVMNLATNAVQAMPRGGTLRVALEVQTLTAPRLAATGAVAPGEYLVLTVADSGTGIAPQVRARIFDPFFTTKAAGTGTGLGLSLVHGIVTELGGAVDVASEPGAGSTFTVYLPRSGEAEEVAPAPAPTPVSSRPHVHRVRPRG